MVWLIAADRLHLLFLSSAAVKAGQSPDNPETEIYTYMQQNACLTLVTVPLKGSVL